MNPKQALETYSTASCGVFNPPLRGIVQLTNSAALAELEFHKEMPIS
ncbi:MAG: hypothetical protein WCO53_09325 [Deltaproteobacteria bacterium]